MTAEAVRALLAADHVTHVPGVWDPLSTALAVRAGHRAVLLAGDAVAAVALGRLDGAAVSATVVADRATTLAASLGDVPLLADAGTGFDSPRPAVWTGLAYHRAGVSGVVLEGDAVATVAALAQEVPELAVIVRVGTRANGFGATVDRCRLYVTAGATAVLPEGFDDPDDLARLHRALPGVPLVLDRSEAAGESPRMSDAALVRAGVRLVLHPLAALLAAARAASLTYRAITEQGAVDQVERMPWAAFTELAGPAPATDTAAAAAASSALDRLQT